MSSVARSLRESIQTIFATFGDVIIIVIVIGLIVFVINIAGGIKNLQNTLSSLFGGGGTTGGTTGGTGTWTEPPPGTAAYNWLNLYTGGAYGYQYSKQHAPVPILQPTYTMPVPGLGQYQIIIPAPVSTPNPLTLQTIGLQGSYAGPIQQIGQPWNLQAPYQLPTQPLPGGYLSTPVSVFQSYTQQQKMGMYGLI